MTHWQVKNAFSKQTLAAIDAAIKASESAHAGQIRFAVEGALDCKHLFRGQSARGRALEVFSQLHVWDTADNTGVLIYLLLADRCVEIVADRGIHAKLDTHHWQDICHTMERAFQKHAYRDGIVHGIQELTAHMCKAFPAKAFTPNELSDRPVVL